MLIHDVIQTVVKSSLDVIRAVINASVVYIWHSGINRHALAQGGDLIRAKASMQLTGATTLCMK